MREIGYALLMEGLAIHS
jgi:hypothetical protein